MTPLRLRLELLLRRHGWAPALSLALLMAAGWLCLVAIPGLQAQALDRRAILAGLAQPKAADIAVEPAPPLVRQRHAAFRALLPPQEATPGIVRILFAEARKAGLVLQQMEYRLSSDAEGQYLTYHLSASLRGPYSRIYRFSEGVLINVPSAALEDIGFRRDSVGSSDTEARLRFAVYLRPAD